MIRLLRSVLLASCLCALGSLLFASGCSKHDAGEVTIGAILSLTGDAAPCGKAAQQAIDMAVQEVNAEGGIHGKRVQVVYEDDRLDPKTAAAAAMKLCTVDKARAIIGPMATLTVEAVLPVAQKRGVVVISPAATDHNLSGRAGFFRTIVSDVYDGAAMAEFARRELSFRKIPVLYVRAAGPAGVAQSFVRRFKELGGEIPLVQGGAPNDKDFRTQLAQMKVLNPEAIYFAAYAAESAIILRQAKELGLHAQMLSHQLVEDPEVRNQAGDAANGVIYTTRGVDPSAGNQVVRSFHDKFLKRYNEEPQNFASNSYDALTVLAKVIAEHGTSYEGIRDGLLALRDYDGASGTFSFDRNGDIMQEMRVMMIRDGQTVTYTHQ